MRGASRQSSAMLFLPLTLLVVLVLLLSALLVVRHLTRNRGHLEALGIPMDRSWGDPLLGSGPFDLHNHLLHQVPKVEPQFYSKPCNV